MFITSLFQDSKDWRQSQVTTSVFLLEQCNLLSKISVGSIIDLDLFESLDTIKQRFFLNFFVERLKIKTIKLILRWRHIEQKEGEINLLKYTKILDFFYDKNVEIILDIRFYSTLKRGKLDLPKWVTKKKNLPQVTQLESRFGVLVSSYNAKLINSLSLISQKFLRGISAIHIESSSISDSGKKYSLDQDLFTELIWKWRSVFSSKKLLFTTRDTDSVSSITKLLDENQWFRFIQIEKAFSVKNPTQIFSIKGIVRRSQFDQLSSFVSKYNLDLATSLYVSNNILSKLSISHARDIQRLQYGLLRSLRFFKGREGVVFIHDLDALVVRVLESKSFLSDKEIIELIKTLNHAT
jgi:hypothetical protein